MASGISMRAVALCGIILCFVLCSVLGGCSEAGSSTRSSDSRGPASRPSDALTIETVSAQSGELGEIVPGRVAFRPQALAAVSSPIQARILSVQVSPGDTVSEGAPLVTLRCAEVAAIRSGLEQARAELDRARRAAAQLGEGHGDQFVLRAPTTGVVTEMRGKIGATASPDGEALVDIGDPAQLGVITDIPENEIESIAVGNTARKGKTKPLSSGMLELPDGDGTTLLKSMRRSQNALPVLVLTARSGVEDRVAGLRGGADDYMTKPFSLVRRTLSRVSCVSNIYRSWHAAGSSGRPLPCDRDRRYRFLSGRVCACELRRRRRTVLGAVLLSGRILGSSGGMVARPELRQQTRKHGYFERVGE